MSNYFKEEKILKKITSFVLCLILVLSMNLTVFAETLSETQVVKQQPVSLEVVEGTKTETICLTIEWTNLNAKYTEGDMRWNPETLKYEPDPEGEAAGWTAQPEIKLKNSSNVDLYVLVDYYFTDAYREKGITFNWTEGNDSLGVQVEDLSSFAGVNMAAVTNPDYGLEEASKITLIGKLDGALLETPDFYSNNKNLGRIDVKIEAIGDVY